LREPLAKSATGTKWSQARQDLSSPSLAHRLKPFSNELVNKHERTDSSQFEQFTLGIEEEFQIVDPNTRDLSRLTHKQIDWPANEQVYS